MECGHEDFPCCGCGPERTENIPCCGCCGMPEDECYCHELNDEYPEDYVDESMDGDHETALRDAGLGADEDYYHFDDGCWED